MEAPFKNKILRGLPATDLAELQPHLELIDLPQRKILEMRHRRVEAVYFLESGLASVVISGGSQHAVEVGIIGHEGMTGLSLLLGADRSPSEVFMQVGGEGWRLGAADLINLAENNPALRRRLLLQSYIFQVQMGFTALANARYRLEERLARWLLMARDRTSGETIDLTHEFLSLMLGVRRPGVTAALNGFEERRLIRTQRGGITILDRHALEDTANGCYGAPEAEYERLFGKA